MEADWALEIGANLPVIDTLWPGFIDLAISPDRIGEISEAAQLPALAQALTAINRPVIATEKQSHAGFWTAKCDLWEPDETDPYEIDPYEMQASPQSTEAALACYIDLLPAAPANTHTLFQRWQDAEQCAKELVQKIRQQELACARADCIVRSALLHDREGFGITIYLTACGENAQTAAASLSASLHLLTEVISVMPPHPTENLLPVQ